MAFPSLFLLPVEFDIHRHLTGRIRITIAVGVEPVWHTDKRSQYYWRVKFLLRKNALSVQTIIFSQSVQCIWKNTKFWMLWPFLHRILNCELYRQARSERTGLHEFGLAGFSRRMTCGLDETDADWRLPGRFRYGRIGRWWAMEVKLWMLSKGINTTSIATTFITGTTITTCNFVILTLLLC